MPELKAQVNFKKKLQKFIFQANLLLYPFLIKTKFFSSFEAPKDRLVPAANDSECNMLLHRQAYLDKLLSEDMDLGIAPSNAVKEILVQHGLFEEKIRVLHNGTKFADTPDHAFISRPLTGGPLRFAYFGALAPYKGVHLLVEAFREIDKDRADLFIFGWGETSYLRWLMRRAGPNVHFKGYFDNLVDVLNQIDIAVFPSTWAETGGPVVILEAQCARKPVIASNIGSMRDFVFHGINGLLFKTGNGPGARERQVARRGLEIQQQIQRRQVVGVSSHAFLECKRFRIIVCSPVDPSRLSLPRQRPLHRSTDPRRIL